jgi:hypothetical protein
MLRRVALGRKALGGFGGRAALAGAAGQEGSRQHRHSGECQ